MAAEEGSEAGQILQSIVGLFYVCSFICGAILLLGIVSAIADFDRFKQRSENAGRQLVIRFIIAAILMSPNTSIETVSKTLGFDVNEETQFCFSYQLKTSENKNGVVINGADNNCYRNATNRLAEELRAKYSSLDENALNQFLSGKFKVVVGVFQVIAMYFYFSAWFKIYSISEGKERQTTYGKQIIVMVFSTIFLNLPTALASGYEFIKSMGLT